MNSRMVLVRWGVTICSITGAAMLGVASRTPLAAQDQTPAGAAVDPGDIAEGLRLYQSKADCRACHGWAADGHKGDNQMPDGPSLREKKYTRALLILTIKCGRPGTMMPAFDKFAYTDGRCYNLKQADLTKYPTRMPDPPATLQPREVEYIADFLMSRVVGKGALSHANCVELWGAETDVCKDLPK
jgi:mono/diheme cytochrome c family protein